MRHTTLGRFEKFLKENKVPYDPYINGNVVKIYAWISCEKKCWTFVNGHFDTKVAL